MNSASKFALPLLVTGQIRSEESFKELIATALESRAFGRIVFSSWREELERAQVLLQSDIVEFVDVGTALPLSGTLDRDLISFFAQQQQMTCGFAHLGGEAKHVVRIRADMAPSLLKSLSAFLEGPRPSLDERQTAIFGASDRVPFWFEDRIIIFSARHQASLSRLPLATVWGTAFRNRFPEFLIHASVLGSNGTRGLQKLCELDQRDPTFEQFGKHYLERRVFGPGEYFSAVEDYLGFVQDHFVFAEDLGLLWSQQHVAYDKSKWNSFREAWIERAISVESQNYRDGDPLEPASISGAWASAYALRGGASLSDCAELERTFPVAEVFPTILLWQALGLYKRGWFEEANERFLRLRASGDQTYDVLVHIYAIAQREGRSEDVAQALSDLLLSCDADWRAHDTAARFHFGNEDWAAVLRHVEWIRALRALPSELEDLRMLAELRLSGTGTGGHDSN